MVGVVCVCVCVLYIPAYVCTCLVYRVYCVHTMYVGFTRLCRYTVPMCMCMQTSAPCPVHNVPSMLLYQFVLAGTYVFYMVCIWYAFISQCALFVGPCGALCTVCGALWPIHIQHICQNTSTQNKQNRKQRVSHMLSIDVNTTRTLYGQCIHEKCVFYKQHIQLYIYRGETDICIQPAADITTHSLHYKWCIHTQ